MKFEEMLEPLKDGKKVRRKGWADCLVEFDKYGDLCFVRDGAFVHYIVDLEDSAATDWEVYHEPILTDKEKEYLGNVIRPFRDRLVCIKKVGDSTNSFEYITIRIASSAYINSWSDIDFPYFKTKSMYKGMKANKEYTLEELGL